MESALSLGLELALDFIMGAAESSDRPSTAWLLVVGTLGLAGSGIVAIWQA